MRICHCSFAGNFIQNSSSYQCFACQLIGNATTNSLCYTTNASEHQHHQEHQNTVYLCLSCIHYHVFLLSIFVPNYYYFVIYFTLFTLNFILFLLYIRCAKLLFFPYSAKIFFRIYFHIITFIIFL